MQFLLELIGWGLVTLIGAFAGSFLGAYMKKKGENLATHEDISKLVDQVRAVTTATKEIEAKISSDVWDRQKRWEVRRDILFDAAKRLGALKDALAVLIATYRTDVQQNLRDNQARAELRLKHGQEWLDAAAAFDNTAILIGVICGEESHQSVIQFSMLARDIATKVTQWDADAMANGLGKFGRGMMAQTEFLRTELNRVEQNQAQSSLDDRQLQAP